jgi:hypothetical protein
VEAAIAIPTPSLTLSADQETSLRHLTTYLSRFDTYAVVPNDAGGTLPGLEPLSFDRAFFHDRRTYSRLMMSREFYTAFSSYDYVLVYQLDCLVFADELESWCARGYDYVGAPWTARDEHGRPYFTGVGNGGLSLRRVPTFLRALERAWEPVERTRRFAAQTLALGLRGARRIPQGPRAVLDSLRTPFVFEDKFWSIDARRLVPGFRVPPAETAVAFAFETEPRFCFEQNGGRLPFGCHRWGLYDRDFWEPFLLSDPQWPSS